MSVRVVDDNQSELHRMPGEDPLFVGVEGGRGKRKCRCWTCCGCILFIVGLTTGVLAIALGLSYYQIGDEVQLFIDQTVALVNGSEGTKQWASPPPVIQAQFYFFNVTNPNEVVKGVKPNLKVMGPYAYSENKTKIDLRWNEGETIVGFNKHTTYGFLPEESKGNLETDMITTVNLPLMGLLIQLQKLEHIAENMTNPVIRGLITTLVETLADQLNATFHEKLFITKSARELLWGYEDPILHFVGDLLDDFGLAGLLPIALPANGTFGLQQNDTIDGPTMVFTGKGDPTNTARFIMWNKETSVTNWGTPYAGMINGTEGTLFHPGVSRNDTLYVFVDQLFRSGYFTYQKDVEQYGIQLYRFVLPPEELKNSTQDPGFYPYGLNGVLNLTAVFPLNVPIFVSKPMFLDADTYFRELVTGLPEVNRDKWDSFLDVEPRTGGVLNAAKRLQINLELKRYTEFPALKKLPDYTLMPIIIAVEAGGLNSSLADEFKQKVYTPVYAINYSSIGLTGFLGLVSLVCLLLLFVVVVIRCEVAVKRRRRNGEAIPLLNDTN